ncbi:MAG: hypothetical protein PHE50_00200 [Dehalococcoidales bacterium]|nr:hypothetical protein [Dehalococcoidales bacterium]
MLGQLLNGLVNGYVDERKNVLDNQYNQDLKKLQVKAYSRKLDELERADRAKQGFLDFLSTSGIDLKSALQQPEAQSKALQAGYSLPDINKFQEPDLASQIASIQTALATGQGGLPQATGDGPRTAIPGQLELSGIKIANGKLMPDLERVKAGKEVPSPSGDAMIQYDIYGREIGRRAIGPGEKAVPAQTKGQNAVDEAFGKEYADFKASGGYADIEKQLSQLRDASTALGDKKKKLTGPLIGNLPESINKAINPDTIAVRDSIYDSAQRNLRLVLGPQFTQKEGEALLARTFDPALPQIENKKRVDRLIKQIETAAKAKQEAADYFEANGTLVGFKGKLWSSADFANNRDTGTARPTLDAFTPKSNTKAQDPLGIR